VKTTTVIVLLSTIFLATTAADQGTPLVEAATVRIQGDYVTAGTGLRNRGYGDIDITGIPSGSTIQKALLYWTILAPTEEVSFKQGKFDGHLVEGIFLGSDIDPCWGDANGNDLENSWSYRADVTQYVSGNGTYQLSDFASYLATGEDPWTENRGLPPMTEGALLVVIYSNNNLSLKDILVYEGNDEFTTLDTLEVTIPGFEADGQGAKLAIICADGQDFPDNNIFFNDHFISVDTLDGSDAQAGPAFSRGNLWDTDIYDVKDYVASGDLSSKVTFLKRTDTGEANDCLVLVALVLSVEREAVNQPPNTKIETADIDSANGTAKFTWSGSDDATPAGNLVYCYRIREDSSYSDWSSWSASTTKTYTNLSPGSYRFQVRAKDGEGAIDPSPASREFSIGFQPPRFLTLPFVDSDIKIQQAWRYTAPIGPNPNDPYAHNGIDYISGDIDQPPWQSFDVVAAADGIAMQSSGGGYGTFVLIRHNETDIDGQHYFTLYSHLESVTSGIPAKSSWDANYTSWKSVKRGDKIGTAGSTGVSDSTWIHLHFEVSRGGYAQNKTDPYDIYRTRDYYPGGSNYTGCGTERLWENDPPSLPANQRPDPPANMAQLRPTDSEIPVGGTVETDSVVFKTTITDPDGDKVRLQVELLQLDEFGGTFDETQGNLKESPLVASGAQATATASGLIPADYHWRARTVDEAGLTSAWVEFGGNATNVADFTVTSVAAGGIGDRAAIRARSVLGAPYLWGGKGYDLNTKRFVDEGAISATGYNYWNPTQAKVALGKGVDCSGLSFWAYDREQLGSDSLTSNEYASRLIYYEGADGQYRGNTQRIGKDDLKPGDLLFFDTDRDNLMDHVAMYVGPFVWTEAEHNVVHASGYTSTLTPAIYNRDQETLVTQRVGGGTQTLHVNGYGRVVSSKIAAEIRALSPVHLVISDPDGLVVSREAPEVAGMYYMVYDCNGDGDLDDVVVLPELKTGLYTIRVIPEPGVDPHDVYSLVVSDTATGEQITFGDRAPVGGIPDTPYQIEVRNGSIEPVSGFVSGTQLVSHGPNPVPAEGCVFWLDLPEGASQAKIMLFNITGRPVFETELDPDAIRFPSSGTWNPVDQNGVPLANGPYVYVLIADGKVIGRGKMVIQR